MLISVIVPTYNRNDLLAKCLDCLQPSVQNVDKEKYEVIVTDDSKEQTAKAFIEANYSWVKWVEGAHKGPAANRNNGAKHAAGEWLAFTDDDCLPDKNWISSIYKMIIEQPSLLAIEGKTITERERERFDESAPVNLTGGYFWSCNIALKKEFFFELRGFEERLPYAAMEDVILRETIKAKGIEIVFNPNVLVVHPWKRDYFVKNFREKINKYHTSILCKKLYPQLTQKMNGRRYLMGGLHFLYHSFPNLFKYRFKGYHVLLMQVMVDFYHSITFSRDFKKEI
jgi:glycosyltransferase involved in cell wall biosynthesis